jgi:hypothetical protein
MACERRQHGLAQHHTLRQQYIPLLVAQYLAQDHAWTGLVQGSQLVSPVHTCLLHFINGFILPPSMNDSPGAFGKAGETVVFSAGFKIR